MEIIIKEEKVVEKKINVLLPYFFKYDLLEDHGDFIIYGRIDKNEFVEIKESEVYRNGEQSFEISKLKYEKIPYTIHCYFKPEYKSYLSTFLEKKQSALNFIMDI